MLTITAKLQIIVPENDAVLLDKTSEAYRNACSDVSDYVFCTHCLTKRKIRSALYLSIRKKYDLKSQMAQSVIDTVIARYKTILKNQVRWIKPRFRKLQYDLVWNRDYSLSEGYFSVNTLDGRVKPPYCDKAMSKYFDHDKYKFGTAKLVKKHDKYFLHIPVSFETEDCRNQDIANVVGIDRGINFVTVAYDSEGKTSFMSGRQIKQKRAQFSDIRKQLQMRGTPSARKRLKAIGQRENRWMQDINHQVSKALVENNPKHTLFVLEDLTGIRNATEKVRRKDRYVSVSWSFYDLEQKLIYKAQMHNDKVIKVDPAYTSQRCPKCGHTERSNRNKKIHLFCCKNCGYKSNDDRIGAINLYQKGICFLKEANAQLASVSTNDQ